MSEEEKGEVMVDQHDKPKRVMVIGREDFETTQSQLGLMLTLLAELPLQKFKESLTTALDVGPFLDPTSWIKNQERVRETLEIAEAFTPAWLLATKLRDRLLGEALKVK